MAPKKNQTLTEDPTPTSPSSNSSSKRTSTSSDFEVSNYAIVFDAMMESKETRQLFFQYLKLNRSVESLMFMDAADEYRSEYAKRFAETFNKNGSEDIRKHVCKNILEMYTMANNLLNKFVFEGGELELNLAFGNKDKLQAYWTNQVSSNIDKIKEGKADSDIISNAISLLETDTLLSDILCSVGLDLRFDQFPRFSRSEMLSKFLTSKGERFTRSIATDISNGYKFDFRFKPHHLEDTTIDDNFIYFGFTLAEDTPDWELTYSDKRHTCESYRSKNTYAFDTDSLKGLRLGKIVTHIPYPIEEVWACFWNIQLHKIIDPMGGAETFNLLKYNSPVSENVSDSNDKPRYSNQQVSCCTKFPIPFMKKRDLPITMTTIRDPNINMIMVAGHTCALGEKREDCIPAQLMFYYMFYKVNENETRFIHTVYTDLKLPINPDLMLKMILLKRAKDYKKGFVKTIKQLRKESTRQDGMMDTSQFKDDMKYNLAIQENADLYPDRSWYQEWSQQKAIRNSLKE